MAELLTYVIEAGGRYKIGWTRDLAGRLQTLQIGNPDELTVCLQGTTPYARELERYLKRHFASQRLRGEWFALLADDLAWIEALPDDWSPPPPKSPRLPRPPRQAKLRPPGPHVRLGKPKHPLQQWREAHGLSQGQLSARAGVKQGTISSLEVYRRIALGAVLDRLRRATGLPTDAFVRPEVFLAEHPEFTASLPDPKPIRWGRPRKHPLTA